MLYKENVKIYCLEVENNKLYRLKWSFRKNENKRKILFKEKCEKLCVYMCWNKVLL